MPGNELIEGVSITLTRQPDQLLVGHTLYRPLCDVLGWVCDHDSDMLTALCVDVEGVRHNGHLQGNGLESDAEWPIILGASLV